MNAKKRSADALPPSSSSSASVDLRSLHAARVKRVQTESAQRTKSISVGGFSFEMISADGTNNRSHISPCASKVCSYIESEAIRGDTQCFKGDILCIGAGTALVPLYLLKCFQNQSETMRPIYIVEEEQYAAQIQSNFDANHFKFCKHYDESEIESCHACKTNEVFFIPIRGLCDTSSLQERSVALRRALRRVQAFANALDERFGSEPRQREALRNRVAVNNDHAFQSIIVPDLSFIVEDEFVDQHSHDVLRWLCQLATPGSVVLLGHFDRYDEGKPVRTALLPRQRSEPRKTLPFERFIVNSQPHFKTDCVVNENVWKYTRTAGSWLVDDIVFNRTATSAAAAAAAAHTQNK